MKLPATPLLVALATLTLPTAVTQAQSGGYDMSQAPYAPGHYVVSTHPGTDPSILAALLGSELLVRNDARSLHLLDAGSAQRRDDLVRCLEHEPGVIYAVSAQSTQPPEIYGCTLEGTLVGAQQCTIAFIDQTGGALYSGQPLVDTIGAVAAQALAAPGDTRVIAVIDTGVDVNHPHFAGRIAPGGYDYLLGVPGGLDFADGLDNDGDGAIDEGVGHGTHIAALATLVDPNAQILPMRVLDSDGNGSTYFVANAIQDAVDLGADVINLSLSTLQYDAAVADSILYAQFNGVPVVSSAGNSGGNVLFPADFQAADWTGPPPSWLPAGATLVGDVLAVGGVDATDVVAVFSAYGDESDLFAPSVDLYSAMVGGGWAWWSGTSMGAGVVSGSVSFLQSIWDQGSSTSTPEQLLLQSAVDLEALNPGFPAGSLGQGRVDLEAATLDLLTP